MVEDCNNGAKCDSCTCGDEVLPKKQYFYSEIFSSIQGEGTYTGRNTLWLRFFLCNLNCNGFGQKNPKDPSTYVLPYENLDVSQYKTIEDLPVFEYGCDSSYSWAKKFKHLQRKGTAVDICNAIQNMNKTEYNPEGVFKNPHSRTYSHMCFTGGEPLLKHGQQCFVEMMEYWNSQNNRPLNITFETNGTQALTLETKALMTKYSTTEFFFSVSPKLFSVSGERAGKAIKPEVVADYCNYGSGQLKFVINGTKESWDEMENSITKFRDVGVHYPVWIMGVGATVEGQKGELEGHMSVGDIADEAIKRGYNVSARVHCYIWDNVIGK